MSERGEEGGGEEKRGSESEEKGGREKRDEE